MKPLLLTFLVALSSLVHAQHSMNELGAKPASLGYAYSTVNDKWALLNNPAGIGRIEEMAAFASFEHKYGIVGLNSVAAGFVSDLSLGAAGLALYRFGDDLYNEQIASLNYANTFGIASLGIRANYIQYTLETFGSQGVFTLDVGGTAQLTEIIGFGAYIRNINQAELKDSRNQSLPTVLYAGVSVKPTDKLFLAIETEKDLERDAVFKAGLEYKFLEKFFARTGIRTNDVTGHFGLGFIHQKLTIDYALTWHNQLGMSHEAALAYTIRK